MAFDFTNKFSHVLNTLLNIIYPVTCGGCGQLGKVLCNECIKTFRIIDEENSCPVCGRWVGKKTICGECIENDRGFIEGRYGFSFEGNLREAIHAFKFQGRKDVGKALVSLLEDKIKGLDCVCDVIIPIPITNKRLKERGFNQSFIISEIVSKIINKPVYHSILIKKLETIDQYKLNRDERKKNIKGAFTVKNGEKIKGKGILLVDDLFTTGATVKEASLTLKRSGVERLYLFALARATT